jgi:hypothetical protein
MGCTFQNKRMVYAQNGHKLPNKYQTNNEQTNTKQIPNDNTATLGVAARVM